jgi:hypothetical protein
MAFHWNDLAGLEATGGAVLRKYERLVEQAHGAQPGSSAHLARLAFENAWLADPAAVKVACEAEEKPAKPKRKPKLVEQMTDEELLGTRHDEEPV